VPITRAPAADASWTPSCDAARGTVHQDSFARSDVGDVECLVGGYAGEQQTAGLLERKFGRLGSTSTPLSPARSRTPLGTGYAMTGVAGVDRTCRPLCAGAYGQHHSRCL